MHMCRELSFFSTNLTNASHNKWLSQMNLFSIISSSWIFSSCSSNGARLYGARKIGVVLWHPNWCPILSPYKEGIMVDLPETPFYSLSQLAYHFIVLVENFYILSIKLFIVDHSSQKRNLEERSWNCKTSWYYSLSNKTYSLLYIPQRANFLSVACSMSNHCFDINSWIGCP